MTNEQIEQVLADHKLWLDSGGAEGKRAILTGADLSGMNFRGANLKGAKLRGANLRGSDLTAAILSGADLRDSDMACTFMEGAFMEWANLKGANLYGADLRAAILRGAILRGVNFEGANLLCYGDMRFIKTLQIERWAIGYTHDTLQIGCRRHAIEKWRKWDTPAGRKWIAAMDDNVTEWAARLLPLVLGIIDASPAEGGAA